MVDAKWIYIYIYIYIEKVKMALAWPAFLCKPKRVYSYCNAEKLEAVKFEQFHGDTINLSPSIL